MTAGLKKMSIRKNLGMVVEDDYQAPDACISLATNATRLTQSNNQAPLRAKPLLLC